MGKAIVVIIIEVIITAALFFGGAWIDLNLVHPADNGEVNGHMMPLFSVLLPLAGAVIMVLVDIIMVIKRLFGSKNKKDK